MNKTAEAKYKEEIFYHNGDYSSFLTGAFISLEGIRLAKESTLPMSLNSEIKIEFSFPKTDKVIKATVLIQNLKSQLFLQFKNIDKESLKLIASYLEAPTKHPAIQNSL